MKIVHGINNLKRQTSAAIVCVGVFDGVHIGHQKIIRESVRQAHLLKAKSAVVTFQPHPAKVLKGALAVAMLTSLKHRLRLLENLGAEICLIINFSKKVASLNTTEFIRKFLINRLNMKMLVVGENFSFGRERMQSSARLKKIGQELNFKLRVVKPARYHSRIISSSLIRHLIEKGGLEVAARLLGRPVSILGTVVEGSKRGRRIGFKTANIDPHHEAIPPSGVYAAYSKLDGKLYKSVLNIGTRPTFGEKEPTIEVHLFGINQKLYGTDIEIYFKKRLRPERRFKNKDCLRKQIVKDAALTQHILVKDVVQARTFVLKQRL